MKYLIIGLGNIGAEYEGTRHNIGFDVVDALARKFDVEFEIVSHGQMARFRHKSRTFLLLKPSTYMNLSGKAMNYWMTKEKVKPSNTLIIVDDINLPLGKLRLKGKGSDGGHNGLRHIQEVLGHTKYPRIRFGIGDEFSKGRQVDFVLGKWTDDEKPVVKKSIDRCAQGVLDFATIGLGRTMNTLNG